MKQFARSIVTACCCCGLFLAPALAQLKAPPELQRQLVKKRSFYEVKETVLQFYAQEKKKLNLRDTGSQRRLSRELKFWNRWFYESESRLEPDGTIANWAKKMYEADQDLQRQTMRTNAPLAANADWQLIGPTSNDKGVGRVLRLGFDPINASIVYAGTARGGLWRSVTAGLTWQPITSFLPSLGVSGIEVAKNDPSTIYVLTGEGDAFISGGFTSRFGYVSFSNGVFKSTDGGASWQKTAEFKPGIATPDSNRYVGVQLRQDPNNSQVLVAATSIGLFRTTNGASSWTEAKFFGTDSTTQFSPVLVFDVEYKPNSSSVLYATGETNVNGNTRSKYFRSTDGGLTFFEITISTAPLFAFLDRLELAVSPAAPNNVYVLCGPGFVKDNDGSNDSFLGLFRSTNSGVSFTKLTGEPDVLAYNPTLGPSMGNQNRYDIALAVSPTNTDNIFTGGLVVFRSTNGGFDFSGNTSYWTWETGDCIHPDVHDLKFNPLDGKLYAATDGGVAVSANNGGSWTRLFAGMSISQFYHMDPTNENNKLWGGTQDNGVMERESGGTFIEFQGGDGYDVMTDNLVGNGNDSYWSTNGAVYTSRNTGTSDITPPKFFGGENRDFGNLDMHATNEDYIFVGYRDGVWYSDDQGASWDKGNLPNILAFGSNVAGDWCIQTCPTNPNRLYAAGSGGFWRIDGIAPTQQTTGTATNLRPNLVGIYPTNSQGNLVKVTDILVHPNNSGRLWITAGGFTAGGKVFVSTDAGATWRNITFNLPNVPANCLLRDGNGTLYVGMDMGVFFLPPDSTAWVPYANGLPRVPVTEMHFVFDINNPAVKYIYASTFARGIWRTEAFTACAATVNVNENLRGQQFFQAGATLNATALIDGAAGTVVGFQSGTEINLLPGFDSKAGIELKAYIRGCNTGSPPLRLADLPAVVDGIWPARGGAEISLRIQQAGNYTVQLLNEKEEPVETLQLLANAGKGNRKNNFKFPKLAPGIYQVAVLQNGAKLHAVEWEVR